MSLSPVLFRRQAGYKLVSLLPLAKIKIMKEIHFCSCKAWGWPVRVVHVRRNSVLVASGDLPRDMCLKLRCVLSAVWL